MEWRQATVRGVPMRWTEAGEGVPVVLVHGIPTSPALWRHVLPQVGGGRCLAFEMVGYGDLDSGGPGARHLGRPLGSRMGIRFRRLAWLVGVGGR